MTLPSLVRPTLNLRRSLFALFVAGLTLLLAGGMLGFAAASGGSAAERPADVSLGTFGVPVPKVGDRAEYRQGFADGPDDPVVYSFERKTDRLMPDADGQPRILNRLEVRWQQPSDDRTPRTSLLASTNGTEHEYGVETSRNETGRDPEGHLRVTQGRVTSFDTAGAERVPRPCGTLNALQGTVVDLALPLTLFPPGCRGPRAPDGFFWHPEASFLAVARGTVDGRAAVVFEDQQDLQWRIHVRVWFVEDVPYPVRWTASAPSSAQTLVLRLAAYDAGTTPVHAGPSAVGTPLAPVATTDPRIYGLDETGIQHPFPASQAFEELQKADDFSDLRDFLATHSGARLVSLRYIPYTEDDGTVDRTWAFGLTDGQDGLGVCDRVIVTPIHVPVVGTIDVPGQGPVSQTTRIHERCWDNDVERIPPGKLPTRLPTVASVWAWWHAFASAPFNASVPNDWHFRFHCFDGPACEQVLFDVSGGYELDWRNATRDPITGNAANTTYHREWSILSVNPAGRATTVDEYVLETDEGPTGPAPFAGRVASPALATFSTNAVSVVWQFPGGRYAAGAGLLAVLVGLAYWLWPSMKSAAFGAFFTRVERPRALDHPMRAQIAQLVEAEPGIHFLEVARRLGLGRGAAENHLRRLVALGILAEQRGAGFVCFFPKGSVDRRLMAVLPAIKNAGARAVLEAVVGRPGACENDVAAAASLSAATVSHHLAKLAALDLVHIERAGRALHAFPTTQALAALAASPAPTAGAAAGAASA